MTEEERLLEADKVVGQALADHDMAQDQLQEEFEHQHDFDESHQVPQEDLLRRHRQGYIDFKTNY